MKTKYFESKLGTLVCALTGKEFPYNVSDKATRQAATNKLAAHQASELERMRADQPALTDRQLFNPRLVPHKETRSEQELRDKARADAPKPQPASAPVNPFEGAFKRKVERLGYAWGQSPAGREARAELKKLSKEWEAKQQESKQQADFRASILPVIDHAKAALDSVRRDPQATQLEVEQAEARLKLAESDPAAYAQSDKEWRQRQANALVSQAVEVDAQARQLQARRDELLKAAYEPVAEAEPVMVEVWYPPNYAPDPSKAGKTILEPLPQ